MILLEEAAGKQGTKEMLVSNSAAKGRGYDASRPSQRFTSSAKWPNSIQVLFDGTRRIRLTRAVAVLDLGTEIRFRQPFLDLLSHEYGAVLASGAAKSDGQVALPFRNVVRQQEE